MQTSRGKIETCKNGHPIEKLAGDRGRCEMCGEIMCQTYELTDNGVSYYEECEYQPVYTLGERGICARHNIIDDVTPPKQEVDK